MDKCAECGKETQLNINGVPICMECEKRRGNERKDFRLPETLPSRHVEQD
jgi:hypothetical protein